MCGVESSHCKRLCSLDPVQNRAGRWVVGSCWDPVSLRWPNPPVTVYCH